MASLDRLTSAQEAWIAEYCRQWLRVQTSTDPADRPRAESAITRLYAAIGESEPCYIWCESPVTAQLAMYILEQPGPSPERSLRDWLRPRPRYSPMSESWASLGAELWGQLGASLRTALGRSLQVVPRHRVWTALASLQNSDWAAGLTSPLEMSLFEQTEMLPPEIASRLFPLGTTLGIPLEDTWGSTHPASRRTNERRSRQRSQLVITLNDSLKASLHSSLVSAPRLPVDVSSRASLWLSSRESTRALKISSYRRTSFMGQQEVLWIAYYLFCRDVLSAVFAPELSERLDCWAEIARSCMWWWPFRKFCFVCDRPAELHMSDKRRLHHDSRPVIRFRDGWSVWAIGGVVVDEQIVLQPETQTIDQIRRERNAEVRRIRIERYGWDRYASEAGAVIDLRRNDVEATLETLLRTPEGEVVLVCACPSTARVYALTVPSQIETCEQAQSWLSGGLARRIVNAG